MAIGTDPFADLLTLQRDMDRIMTKFGGQARMTGEEGRSFWMPPVDVFKQGADMMLRVELPGVNPSDINVSITGNMLTIRGERRQDRQINESDYVMRESTYGSFERRITLPEDIDASQVRAQYRAGVLEITVPNTAMIAQQPRSVQVTGAGTQTLGAGQQGGYMGGQQQYAGQQGAYGQQQGQATQEYSRSQQYGQTTGGAYQTQPTPSYETERGPQAGTTYGQPSQPSAETRGREEGMRPEQPEYGQQPPRAQTEGGWVAPQGEAGPAGGERRGEQDMSGEDEHSHRTKLGGWLHGDK